MNKGALAAMLAGAIALGVVLGVGGTVAVSWVGKAVLRPYGPAAMAGQVPWADAPRMDGGGRPWADDRSPLGGRGQMGRYGSQDGGRSGGRMGDPDGAGPLTCPDCGYAATATPAPRPFPRR